MSVPKVLVANRGEIAVRICRSAEELGWKTVALYTEKDASHASYAHEAILLDSPARYMDAEHIVDIARRTQCTHVHPGYGFLSESPELASLLSASSSHADSDDTPVITFVGPTLETLKVASDKMLSRELASSVGVPVAPGTRVSNVADIYQFVKQLAPHSFPVVVKALDGGGGRGIRLVNTTEDVENAFRRCLGESPSKQVFVERALVGPGWKHVEIQVVGDGNGNVTHLWERECSVQRRFQKIIEMAPSTLSRATVKPLVDAALKMAQKLRYLGLGTFEFLVNPQLQEWVFLEINPRIQVEHTVTEEILNVDLVHVQLRLSLPGTCLADVLPEHASSPAPPNGQAIQLRLVAENPHRSFQLSPGTLRPSDISWPSGRGVRVDTWLSTGPYPRDHQVEWNVGVDFDSVLAKIIIRGASFGETIARAQRALREIRIEGETKTNLHLLAGVVAHPDWRAGTTHTRWLEENLDQVLQLGANNLLSGSSPTSRVSRVSSVNNTAGAPGAILLQPGSSFQLSLSSVSETLPRGQAQVHSLVLSTIRRNVFPDELSGTITTSLSSTPLAFSLTQSSTMSMSSSFEFANPSDPSHLHCPLAGKIVELHPALIAASVDGSTSSQTFIREGDVLVVVSAMKMESVVNASRSGHISRIGKGIEIGAVIPEGSLVCALNFEEKDWLARL